MPGPVSQLGRGVCMCIHTGVGEKLLRCLGPISCPGKEMLQGVSCPDAWVPGRVGGVGEKFPGHLGPYLVALVATKGNAPCILHIIAHKSIAAGILQSLLDVRRLVTNHVNHQLGPLQLPQLLICRLHLRRKRQG